MVTNIFASTTTKIQECDSNRTRGTATLAIVKNQYITLVITEVFESLKEIVTGAATINADPVVARFAESCPTKLTDVLEKDLFGIDSVLSA